MYFYLNSLNIWTPKTYLTSYIGCISRVIRGSCDLRTFPLIMQIFPSISLLINQCFELKFSIDYIPYHGGAQAPAWRTRVGCGCGPLGAPSWRPSQGWPWWRRGVWLAGWRRAHSLRRGWPRDALWRTMVSWENCANIYWIVFFHLLLLYISIKKFYLKKG